MSTSTKQITAVKLEKDFSGLFIAWVLTESVPGVPLPGIEDDPDSVNYEHPFTCAGKHRPHKDLIDAMKGLRKFAIEICGFEVDKRISDWMVYGFTIAGSIELQNSRVKLNLGKDTPNDGILEISKFPQVTMFPEKDEPKSYHKAAALTSAINLVIDEAWEYMNGKYAEEDESQLKLFPTGKVRSMPLGKTGS